MGFVPARRDDLAAVVTVAGTVTANQGTAGAAAWPVDASGHTVPVSEQAGPLTDSVDGSDRLRVYDPRVRASVEALRFELEQLADGNA